MSITASDQRFLKEYTENYITFLKKRWRCLRDMVQITYTINEGIVLRCDNEDIKFIMYGHEDQLQKLISLFKGFMLDFSKSHFVKMSEQELSFDGIITIKKIGNIEAGYPFNPFDDGT